LNISLLRQYLRLKKIDKFLDKFDDNLIKLELTNKQTQIGILNMKLVSNV